MKVNLKELARQVNGRVFGDSETVVTDAAGIMEAKKGDITFASHPKYAREIGKTRASAIVLARHDEKCSIPMLVVENPQYAFSRIISYFYVKPFSPAGVDPKAVIGRDVTLGKDISIQHFATIEDRVKIGDRVTIYPGVYVGVDSEIGEDCCIYPNVTIMRKISIGKRVIIHSGTVIGSDGYGYVHYKGKYHKIPQVGEVLIEDDVEIGSNVSIDRATLGKTIIKRGTKIDNLVQIAHNVKIGEDSIIVAQVGISGSSEIGNNVILAGQVGIVDHVMIGDNSRVGAQSGVNRDIETNQRVMGSPFMPFGKYARSHVVFTRLPEIKNQLKAHEERLKKLEKQSDKKEHGPQ